MFLHNCVLEFQRSRFETFHFIEKSTEKKMASKKMPLMPDLDINFNPDDEEEEDAAEEKNLMAILLKLKNAKSSIAASRKRQENFMIELYAAPWPRYLIKTSL